MSWCLRPAEDHMLIWRLVRESFRPHAAGYAVAIVSMLVVAAMTAASAWIMRDITDELLVDQNVDRIYLIAGGVAAIFIIKGFATFAQGITLSRVGNAIIAERQRIIFDRVLAQGISFYHRMPSSDLITRVTHNAQAARAVLDLIVTSFVRDLFTLIGLVVVMVVQQPILSLVAFVLGPVAIYGINQLLKRVRKIMEAEFLSLARIVQVMQETTIGVRIVKAFNLENLMRQRMHKAIADVTKRANSIAALEAATSPIMETLAGLAIAAVVLVSGLLLVGTGGTPGSVMAFITALLLAYEPAKRLARMRVSLQTGLVGVRMMFELADQPLTLKEADDAKPLGKGAGRLEFRDVHFSYNEGEPVLRGLDLTFHPGRMTALVGPSGSGKSTILNLIMRMYDPDAGAVVLDGQDISRATLHSLRERTAYVSQDTFLFDGTILDNIRLGRESASDDEVYEAAKAANAHGFITSLPGGYATQVGENGVFLSGGQKQRLSIARALLRDADILLLDEATSALDAESEALFRDALERLAKGRTTIAIAHRLSTVHKADQIVVMENGRIVETGVHGDLLETTGLYRKLYDYQLMG